MLQAFYTPILQEACPHVLETERLSLRRPTLADVKAMARLANDRRIAENTRRLPHPYSQDDAVAFVRFTAAEPRELAFLIEHNFEPIGMVGINMVEHGAPELGYWLGVEHWGQGFGTEAARAVIDYFFEEFDHDQLFAGARVAASLPELLSQRHVALGEELLELVEHGAPADPQQAAAEATRAGHDPERLLGVEVVGVAVRQRCRPAAVEQQFFGGRGAAVSPHPLHSVQGCRQCRALTLPSAAITARSR